MDADSTVLGLIGLLGCDEPGPGACWKSVRLYFPDNSLAIAVEVFQGCNYSALTGAYLNGNTLNLSVNFRQHDCPPGAGAMAAPTLSLLAVPLIDLPPTLLSIDVYYAGRPSERTALADLRRPINPPPDTDSRRVEVHGAFNMASAAAGGGSMYQVRLLAARRFASGPVACVPAEPTDSEPGYVIAFEGDAGQDDYSRGRIVHCPAAEAM